MITVIIQLFKSKLTRILILIAIFLILLLSIYILSKRLNSFKEENARISQNFSNISIERNRLDSTLNENYKIYHSQSLQLTESEFKRSNEKFMKELNDIGIKLKNLKSVTTINYNYNYSIDTGIKVSKKNDSVFYCSFDDSVFNLKQKITLIDNKSNLKIDSLQLKITDKITIPYEIQYKRYWIFWKRPIGVTVHVVSENKNLYINKVENIDLIHK